MPLELLRNSLVEPLQKADLWEPLFLQATGDEKDEMLFERFTEGFNNGTIYPVGVRSVLRPEVTQEIQEYENRVTVVPTVSVPTLEIQARKLFERFTPGTGLMTETDYGIGYGQYLERYGFNSNEPVGQQLRELGSVYYFPRTLGRDGKLVMEKRWYFPRELQMVELLASEFKLMPDDAQKRLKASRGIAVGLSVGSGNLAAMLKRGITDLVVIDPGMLHQDQMGRLDDFMYRPDRLGVVKTMIAVEAIMTRFPEANIKAFPGGLTENNVGQIFDLGDRDLGDGFVVVSEEVDDFGGKSLTRQAVHSWPAGTDWHLLMLGDVGYRVTVSHESPGEKPFHGFLGRIDPQDDVYGRNSVAQYGRLLPLFASVGGFDGIPDPLLGMMERGEVGDRAGAKVTRVPQSDEATSLAKAACASMLAMMAQGIEIKPTTVLDLRADLKAESVTADELQEEQRRQREMNQKIFGFPSFAE